MNMDQYVGCIIQWNGQQAEIVGATDCYGGCWFTLQYVGSNDTFKVDAFDRDLMAALPNL